MTMASNISKLLHKHGIGTVHPSAHLREGLKVRNLGGSNAVSIVYDLDYDPRGSRTRRHIEEVADVLRQGGYLPEPRGLALVVTRPSRIDRAAHALDDGRGCLTAPDSGLPSVASVRYQRRVHCTCGRRWQLHEEDGSAFWKPLHLRPVPARGDRLQLKPGAEETHGWSIPAGVVFQVQRVLDERMTSGDEASVLVEIWPADQELPPPGAEAASVWIEDVDGWSKPKK